uniref:Uncharacterized protein n=1 Tax=Mycena chlorophos TaxID=658473 RepID=A0ABQ0L7Z1_MYCCL|nr:predicted protein [Mycena chlorophos]
MAAPVHAAKPEPKPEPKPAKDVAIRVPVAKAEEKDVPRGNPSFFTQRRTAPLPKRAITRIGTGTGSRPTAGNARAAAAKALTVASRVRSAEKALAGGAGSGSGSRPRPTAGSARVAKALALAEKASVVVGDKPDGKKHVAVASSAISDASTLCNSPVPTDFTSQDGFSTREPSEAGALGDEEVDDDDDVEIDEELLAELREGLSEPEPEPEPEVEFDAAGADEEDDLGAVLDMEFARAEEESEKELDEQLRLGLASDDDASSESDSSDSDSQSDDDERTSAPNKRTVSLRVSQPTQATAAGGGPATTMSACGDWEEGGYETGSDTD